MYSICFSRAGRIDCVFCLGVLNVNVLVRIECLCLGCFFYTVFLFFCVFDTILVCSSRVCVLG